MKRFYEVQVYFDYPYGLRGMRETKFYGVVAGSVVVAAKVGKRLADRDRNGGYAPRVESVEQKGVVEATA